MTLRRVPLEARIRALMGSVDGSAAGRARDAATGSVGASEAGKDLAFVFSFRHTARETFSKVSSHSTWSRLWALSSVSSLSSTCRLLIQGQSMDKG